MDISKIDKNFKEQSVAACDGKATYAIPSKYFSLYGVQYDEKEKCFVRMPLAVAATVNEGVAYLSRHTAGGRLCFATDSTLFEIAVTYNGLEMMKHMPLTGSSGFSLFEITATGEKFISNLAPFPNAMEGYTSAVKLMGGEMREYVLYFPLYNNVRSLSITLDENATIKQGKPYRAIAPILYYGSSITQGGCASRPDNAYQALICKRNNIDFINLGFSGNAKAEKTMVEYLSGLDCSLFVCDYDHNAPSAEYLEKTHYALYEEYRKGRPNTPILFISKPDITGDDEGEKREKIIFTTYQKAKRQGDKNVYFLPGKSFYGKRDRWDFAVDGGHPTDYGFAVMAEKIYKKMLTIDRKFGGKKYD